MTAQQPINMVSRSPHLAIIALAAISFVSGYIAFDVEWSGVGILNRSTYFMAHQTSGAGLLVLCLVAVCRMVRRAGSLWLGRPALDRVASAYHIALLAGFVGAGALAVWGTACGGYPFHLFFAVRLPLSLPDSVCLVPMKLFEFHKELSNLTLVAVGLHFVAAAAHLTLVQDGRVQQMFTLRSDRETTHSE